jgi:hypothetical protein
LPVEQRGAPDQTVVISVDLDILHFGFLGERYVSLAAPGRADQAPDPSGDARYREYGLATLKTRVEMWRQTGNPWWLTEEPARVEAFGLLGRAVTQAPDDEAVRAALDFLAIRAAALGKPARIGAVAELQQVVLALRVRGIAAELTPPDTAVMPNRRVSPANLPDLADLARFCAQAPGVAPLDLDTVTRSSLWPRRWSR